MSDLELKLRITADGRVVVVETEKVKGGLKDIGTEAEKAGKKAKEAFHEDSLKAYLQQLDRVGRLMRDVAGVGAVVFVSSKVKEYTGELVQAQIQLDRINASLRFVAGGDQAKAGREFDYVRDKARELGLELNTSAAAYTKLAASARGTALEGRQTREIFEAITQAGTVMGLSAADQAGALLAVSQMMSKGTVQAEELRGQLGERLPGAFNIAARAMGVSTMQLGKMLEQGQVLASDFLPKFAAQVKSELGDSVAAAAHTAQAEVNRMDTSWQNWKQQMAQSGIADAAIGAMRAFRDEIDSVAQAIENARKQGLGFWGQMGAGFRAGLGTGLGGDLVTARGGDLSSDQAAQLRAGTRLQQLVRELAAMGTSIDEAGPYALRLKEEARQLRWLLMDATRRSDESNAALNKYSGQNIYDARDRTSVPFDADRDKREAADKAMYQLRLKLLAEFGDKRARYEKELADLEVQTAGMADDQVAQLKRQLWEKIYGAEAKQKVEANYRELIAQEEGYQRFLTGSEKARVEAVKMALDQDLISQRQYYESVAQLEVANVEARKRSVQAQLDAAQGMLAKDPTKKADVARYKAELEQLATEEQQVEARKNNNIAKLEEKLRDQRLAINAETYKKELSAAEAFVADFQKRYSEAMKKALLAGDEETVKALMALFQAGLNRGEFQDAKKEFDALFADFKRQLESVKDQAEETGGIVGMLQAATAGAELREKFLPALQAAINKMRELARDNPALQQVVSDSTREVQRGTGEAIAGWRGMVDDFIGVWRDGARRAVEGGKPAFLQWIADLRNRIKGGIAQYLAEIFARRYVLNFVAQAAGAMGLSGLATAAGGAAAGGSGFVGGLFGGASSVLGGSAGATASIGAGAFDLATAFGAGTEAAAAFANTMMAAVPVIGAVVAIGAVLYSMFGNDGPENPTFRISQGTGGRGAFGGVSFSGNYSANTAPLLAAIGQYDAAAMRLLSPEQQQHVGSSLAAYTQRGLRSDGQPAQFAFPEGDSTASEQIAIELLKSRYGAVFDELNTRGAAAIRAFEGTSEELQKFIGNMLTMQSVVKNAAGRLDWFSEYIADFAKQPEQVQQAIGQMVAYFASDIHAMFDEAANGPRTVMQSWSRLGEQIRGWTDMSAEGIVQLGNLTQQRYQAEMELVKQIQNAVEQTDAMFKDTIRDITLQTLEGPDRYKFIQGETDSLMRKVGETNDPELIMQMSQRITGNIRDLFGMLDPATQRARLGEFTRYLNDANDVVQQRLAAARRQVEDEHDTRLATTVATAIEKALKDFGEKVRAAATDIQAGGSDINNAATTLTGISRNGIRVDFHADVPGHAEVNYGGG